MNLVAWLLIALAALAFAGVVILWAREVGDWWRWRMKEFNWFGRKK